MPLSWFGLYGTYGGDKAIVHIRHRGTEAPRNMLLTELLPQAMRTLLSELTRGPGNAGFMLNRGDRGMIAALGSLSAVEAGARPNGRSSVAAHVRHLVYGLGLLNRAAAGEDPWSSADWAEAWRHQQVNDAEWRALVAEFERLTAQWLEVLSTKRDWDETTLPEAIGSIAHLAYHLGAIRQIVTAAAGPSADDAKGVTS